MNFEMPKMNVILFNSEDVITTSGGNDIDPGIELPMDEFPQ